MQRRTEVWSSKCGHTLTEWLALREGYGEKCLRCGATDRTLARDHVIPLALGGADTIDNIQPLCKPCNSWKGNRVLDFRDGTGDRPMVENTRKPEGEGQWLPVAEAAQALGISAEALRGRIRRNTIASDVIDGRRVVWVPGTERTNDDQPDDRTDLLIAELQDRIRSLEEANRENRRIIAALTSRIPAIVAPQEAQEESPQTVEEEPKGAESRSSAGVAEEDLQRRGFWSRLFGS